MTDSIHGYNLFNSIEDSELRSRNRATVMTNIVEDNIYEDTRKLTDAGQQYLLEYWASLPEEDRASTYSLFETELRSRNLIEEVH